MAGPSKIPGKQDSKIEQAWSAEELEELANPVEVGSNEDLAETDLAYVKDARALIRRRMAAGLHRWLPWLAVALVAGLIGWASWAEVEEVTRGTGKVIPAQSVQVIQSLEGGIIEEINVEEGQTVEKDQVLLRIRDAIFASSYKENQEKCDVLEARLYRHLAEAQGFAELKFPATIREDLNKLETSLFEKRRADYQATKRSLDSRLQLAKKEAELLLEGTKSRAVSEIELLRAQKQVEEIDGEIKTLDTSSQRTAMESYHKDKGERDALVQALLRDKDRLDRTQIRAPVKGTVNKIYINTVGRVVGSGVDIMEIVPSDDTLLIEANVRPADIAFIRPGQEAMVKFTAYNFSMYGGLPGILEHISADTITNEKNESFYQIKVRTPKSSLGRDASGKELPIIPGMVVEVDILTGKRTILTYILNPINRARMRALRER